MRLLLDSPPAPDTRSKRSVEPGDPEREPRGWRALAHQGDVWAESRGKVREYVLSRATAGPRSGIRLRFVI